MNKVIFSILLILLFTVGFIYEAYSQENPANKITSVKIKEDKESINVLIELTQNPTKLPEVMATLETVSFTVPAIYELKENHFVSSMGFLTGVQWFPNASETIFEIKRKHYCPVNISADFNFS